MAVYAHSVGAQTYRFENLKEVMAKATPARSGDYLAGVAALNDGERVAAQMVLADIPLSHFLQEVLIPYETDEVTRLIIDTHDKQAFAVVSHLTVGGFRDWLLSRVEDHARTGPGAGRAENPGRYAVPRHLGPARSPVYPPATQPPDGRTGRHCREYSGWPAARKR